MALVKVNHWQLAILDFLGSLFIVEVIIANVAKEGLFWPSAIVGAIGCFLLSFDYEETVEDDVDVKPEGE